MTFLCMLMSLGLLDSIVTGIEVVIGARSAIFQQSGFH